MDSQTGYCLDPTLCVWPLALDAICDSWWDWHLSTSRLFGSADLLNLYGLASGQTVSVHDLNRLIHPEDALRVQRDRQAHLEGRTPVYYSEHRVQGPEGRWKWILSRGQVLSRDRQGQPLRMVGTDTDLSAQKDAEHQVWQQSHFDTLTLLPNRRMLSDRFTKAMNPHGNSDLQLACLLIDLDHFKEVNDTFGHERGDALLIEAAHRIVRCVRDTDTVARMGGDEFGGVSS